MTVTMVAETAETVAAVEMNMEAVKIETTIEVASMEMKPQK